MALTFPHIFSGVAYPDDTETEEERRQREEEARLQEELAAEEAQAAAESSQPDSFTVRDNGGAEYQVPTEGYPTQADAYEAYAIPPAEGSPGYLSGFNAENVDSAQFDPEGNYLQPEGGTASPTEEPDSDPYGLAGMRIFSGIAYPEDGPVEEAVKTPVPLQPASAFDYYGGQGADLVKDKVGELSPKNIDDLREFGVRTAAGVKKYKPALIAAMAELTQMPTHMANRILPDEYRIPIEESDTSKFAADQLAEYKYLSDMQKRLTTANETGQFFTSVLDSSIVMSPTIAAG